MTSALFQFLHLNLRWLLGGFLLCFFSAFGQTFFIALFGGNIRQDFALSHGEFGTLYMIATVCSAMTLPFIGRILDIMSVATCALITLFALVTACMLMARVDSVWLLGMTLYLLRLFGQGMMTHTALTAIGRWFSLNRGRAVSLVTMGHQASEAILPMLFLSVAATKGWRTSWLVGAVVLLLVALPLIVSLMRLDRSASAQREVNTVQEGRQWQRNEVLRDRHFWILLLAVLAPSFIGTSAWFHQAWLIELRGWPHDAFARAFVWMALTTIVFTLLSGWLVDRFSALALLPSFLFPLALGCLTLAKVDSVNGIHLFMFLAGMSYGFSSTLFGALWPELYGTRHLGSIRSITVALMVLSSAIGPGVTGLLIDAGVALENQFLVMGVYCLIMGVVMIGATRWMRTRS